MVFGGRVLTCIGVLAILISSCGGDQSGPSTSRLADDETVTTVTVSSDPWVLACEEIVSIQGAREETFEGYSTPEEAVNAWNDMSGMGIPKGTWTKHEANKWILIDGDGNTVARTVVSTMTGNAVTTFATERFASDGLEFCA